MFVDGVDMRPSMQLAKRGVCVIYMNIRPSKDDQGYPGRDNIPADILTDQCVNEHEYRIRCFTFFAAVFKVLGVSRLNDSLWYNAMCDIGNSARTSFFTDLQYEYNRVSRALNL